MMATNSVATTLTNYQPTDAQVRAFMDDWYDSIEAMGWTQSDDLNQLDRSTVTWADLSSSPYQIHYMDDAYHSTAPCYLKTIWRSYSTNYFGMTMWVASATTGLGAVVAPSCTSTNTTTTGNKNGTHAIHTTWAADKYSGIFLEYPGTTANSLIESQFGFFFSRLTDANGDPTGDGWTMYFHSTGSNPAPMCVWDDADGTCEYNYTYTSGYGPSGRMNSTGRPEIYRHWATLETEWRLVPYAFSVDASAVPIGGELDVAIAGANFGKHTYRRVFDLGYKWSAQQSSSHALMTIWE